MVDTMDNIVSLLFAASTFVVGLFAKPGIDYFYGRKQRSEQRSKKATILAESLRGELRSIRNTLKSYRSAIINRADTFQHASLEFKFMEQPEKLDELKRELAAFSKIECPIYAANRHEIGLLWQLVSREVAMFYGDLDGLKNFSLRMLAIEDSQTFERYLHDFFNETHSLVREITILDERLICVASGPDYPIKRSKNQKRAKGLLATHSQAAADFLDSYSN